MNATKPDMKEAISNESDNKNATADAPYKGLGQSQTVKDSPYSNITSFISWSIEFIGRFKKRNITGLEETWATSLNDA